MAGQDVTTLVSNMWSPIFQSIWNVFYNLFSLALISLVLFLILFLLCSRINPFKLSPEYLVNLKISFLPYDLLRWILYDFLINRNSPKKFNAYGFSIYVGPQGAGKTISMVEYLQVMKRQFPNCKIVTNFKCDFADCRMKDWRDFLEIRNGEDGVIFAIDEIQGEYSSSKWQDFPEVLLSQISMQRKQCIKVIASAQVYSRVAKPIREQTFSVYVCYTYFKRLTVVKQFDASKFVCTGDNAYSIRKGTKPISRYMFVQSNDLRESYDTYEVIERMKKLDFIPRDKRGC